MDPLSALRDFTIRGELDKIHRVGDEFRFGNEYIFPCKVETAYRSKQGSLYTLETLVFFVKNRHIKQPEYIKSATNQGVSTVTFVDRKPLLDYLEGRSSSSEAIEFVLPHAANDVEEYRPEDPQFLSLRSSTGAAANSDDASNLGFDENSEGRAPENVDFMSLIAASEKSLRDRNAILLCRNRDFYGIYVGALRREQEKQRVEPQQRKDALAGAKGRPLGGDKDDGFHSGPKAKMLKGSKIGEGVPIILVPSASNTLITIYNVKEFLEDGVFIPTDVKMKQMKGPKPECVTVQKKFSRDKDKVMAAYEVRDKPSTLKADDWDRVVAVFVLGKEWQFKDWPFKDHVEIFNKSKLTQFYFDYCVHCLTLVPRLCRAD